LPLLAHRYPGVEIRVKEPLVPVGSQPTQSHLLPPDHTANPSWAMAMFLRQDSGTIGIATAVSMI
jgi:hypothetical protein